MYITLIYVLTEKDALSLQLNHLRQSQSSPCLSVLLILMGSSPSAAWQEVSHLRTHLLSHGRILLRRCWVMSCSIQHSGGMENIPKSAICAWEKAIGILKNLTNAKLQILKAQYNLFSIVSYFFFLFFKIVTFYISYFMCLSIVSCCWIKFMLLFLCGGSCLIGNFSTHFGLFNQWTFCYNCGCLMSVNVYTSGEQQG